MTADNDTPSGYASPPCLAHEIDPAYFDPLAVGLPQVKDVTTWRRAERMRLLVERAALPMDTRSAAAVSIADHLDGFLAKRFATLQGLTISAWWPIKAELDLRFWLAGLAARGARGALPLVVTRNAPLQFRAWTPHARMERGFWNILVPADGPFIVPDITLAPVVGWDVAGYRLGYGGGYFDRTLSAIWPRPLAIGVGLQSACIATIFPQQHDVSMQVVLTETGIHLPQVVSST